MRRSKQAALQAAILLYERLYGQRSSLGPVPLPFQAWNNIGHVCRQIDRARQRGWQLAAQRLTRDLAAVVADCQRQLKTALGSLEAANHQPRRVSVSDIYHDLTALKGEFAAVEIDLQEHEILATTDTIVLEDIRLGPFQIHLDWQLIGHTGRPYRVVALDPHPAARSDEVTHPHVRYERLCEGEGQVAIAAALAAGRFYDFSLLVSQVLHTYGRGSAYVELGDWRSVPCDSCGGYVAEEERDHCEHCGDVLCSRCTCTCEGCQAAYCGGCLKKCIVCGKEYCPSCLEICPACQERSCAGCRADVPCGPCYDQQHEEQEHDSSQKFEGEALAASAGVQPRVGPAVQPHGLGQAALSAGCR